MRTVQEINTAIIQGSLTNDELVSIIDAVKFARSRLAQQTKWTLRIGDTVSFTSSKTGMDVTGRVRKIAIKYVTVDTGQTLWRVPANMLSKVDDRALA
jgi:3-oxoacyl-ACP reductase-like protein